MEWKKLEKKESGIDVPESWIFPKYYEALNTLFRIENALRVFVYLVLKCELGDNWLTINLEGDDVGGGTISTISKRRMHQAATTGYVGYQLEAPVLHLTSGELIRLITSDSSWKYFAAHFPGSLEVMKIKLYEIIAVRNDLAHFRPVRDDDVDLLKFNARHSLSRVEAYLRTAYRQANVVPTNTVEPWYERLRVLGTDNCTFRFVQSDDEKWIRCALVFRCSLVEEPRVWSTVAQYRVFDIASAATLREFPALRGAVAYLSDIAGSGRMSDPKEPLVTKSLRFVFSRKRLAESVDAVEESFRTLLANVDEELELIRTDGLARGKFVRVRNASGRPLDGTGGSKIWMFDASELTDKVSQGDPIEFWGGFSPGFGDELSASATYPWMPIPVSNEELPF